MLEIIKDFYKAISIIDLIYLILTILSLINCYKKGFILSILSIAKWLLAYIITLILFPRIKPYVKDIIDNEYVLDVGLGIIGLLGIPLDMMTITIAAITIGIAVDNSIHYIYRFKEEFNKIKDYNKTLKTCHSTVGVAILNTSITIVFGFSILVLSKFIPTIYFGVFTGLAMLFAMISVLTLLPALILIIKPFGKSS